MGRVGGSKENDRLADSLTGHSCAGWLKNLKQLVSAGMPLRMVTWSTQCSGSLIEVLKQSADGPGHLMFSLPAKFYIFLDDPMVLVIGYEVRDSFLGVY